MIGALVRPIGIAGSAAAACCWAFAVTEQRSNEPINGAEMAALALEMFEETWIFSDDYDVCDLLIDWSDYDSLTGTMASKRVEKHMRQTSMPSDGAVLASHIQIIQSSVDTQKSIEELINAGVDPKKDPKFKRKASNPPRSGLPPSFNHRPPSKSRGGSSAGHSREGSSDDGIGSCGRSNTLSPASVGDQLGTFPGSQHNRVFSAPELLHEQYHEQMKNMNTQMVPPYGQPMHKPLGGMLQAPSGHHRGALSYDANAHLDPDSGGRHLEVAFTDDGRKYFIDHISKTTHWTDPRKSQSLGHLTTVAGVEDDGLGVLPANWAKEYNSEGDPYFIDHNSKTTTWYDPRLPREVQEERILARHGLHQGQQTMEVAGGGYDHHQQMHPTFSPRSQQTTIDRVQQLQQERCGYQERQQQLLREGLLHDQQQRSPQQQYQASPISPPQRMHNMTGHNDPFLSQYAQHRAHHDLLGAPFQHHRDVSNDSAVDSAMDVDGYPAQDISMAIDPATIVPGFNPADLNPREFDKYLNIS
uniref:WW domain-containing protein n=1 Tax=Plectus sambesii TaxID=2011161 RepID=A0A914XJC8_9BILA